MFFQNQPRDRDANAGSAIVYCSIFPIIFNAIVHHPYVIVFLTPVNIIIFLLIRYHPHRCYDVLRHTAFSLGVAFIMAAETFDGDGFAAFVGLLLFGCAVFLGIRVDGLEGAILRVAGSLSGIVFLLGGKSAITGAGLILVFVSLTIGNSLAFFGITGADAGTGATVAVGADATADAGILVAVGAGYFLFFVLIVLSGIIAINRDAAVAVAAAVRVLFLVLGIVGTIFSLIVTVVCNATSSVTAVAALLCGIVLFNGGIAFLGLGHVFIINLSLVNQSVLLVVSCFILVVSVIAIRRV